MTGGCEGAASGAGIRFSKAGICGAGDPRRVVGSRTRPPWFANPPTCPRPPRARPGVDPTTHAAVTNTAAKTRFMIVAPHFAPPLDALYVIVRGQRLFICLALLGSRLRSFEHPTAPLMSRQPASRRAKIAASARLILRRAGGRLAGTSRPPSECQILSRGQKRPLAPTSSVAVASERRARRGHGGCVCSRGERRDRDQ